MLGRDEYSRGSCSGSGASSDPAEGERRGLGGSPGSFPCAITGTVGPEGLSVCAACCLLESVLGSPRSGCYLPVTVVIK